MTTIKTTLVKTISVAQFSWSFKRGLIWERDGEFFSKDYEYCWMPPHMNNAGDICGGHYHVLTTELTA